MMEHLQHCMTQVVDGQVQCPYHGWEYNKEGECTKMPSTAFCGGVRVSALPCLEKDGERCMVIESPATHAPCSAQSICAIPWQDLKSALLTCIVCAGLVWVWPGTGEAPEVPTFSRPPSGYTVHSEIEVGISKPDAAPAVLHSHAHDGLRPLPGM